jgi:hypothetical protein
LPVSLWRRAEDPHATSYSRPHLRPSYATQLSVSKRLPRDTDISD